jgi:hypothetical protein
MYVWKRIYQVIISFYGVAIAKLFIIRTRIGPPRHYLPRCPYRRPINQTLFAMPEGPPQPTFYYWMPFHLHNCRKTTSNITSSNICWSFSPASFSQRKTTEMINSTSDCG